MFNRNNFNSTFLVSFAIYRIFDRAVIASKVMYTELKTFSFEAELSARFWNSWTSSMFDDHPMIWKAFFLLFIWKQLASAHRFVTILSFEPRFERPEELQQRIRW